MLEALLVAAAVAANGVGLAWLALAMAPHWEQVRGAVPAACGGIRLLRALGVSALAGSLALCLVVDHGSMASLVWVMSLAAGALVVAGTLSWRPRWLAPLAAWVPSARTTP